MQRPMRTRRLTLMAGGTILLINAVAVNLLENIHAGLWFTYALGAVLLLWGLLLPHLPRILRILLCVALSAATVWVGGDYLIGSIDTVDGREDAVIVLGTGIHGRELSPGLRNRLDAALAYHAANPNVLIVVSGGQGPQEEIPEAEAMAHYLRENGVAPALIIEEAASTSTIENFTLTRQLLDARLGPNYRVAYITNDFHIFRAGLIADACGFPDATHAHAPTPLHMLIPNGLRECAALVKFLLHL